MKPPTATLQHRNRKATPHPLGKGIAAFAAIAAFTAVQPALAVTLSWDPNSTVGVSLGGDGTWDLSNTNRWYDAVGIANVSWTDGNDAAFAGAGGNVTVGVPVAPLSLKFDSNYTLGGSAITTGTLNVKDATTVTINNILSGTGLTIGGLAGYGGTLILGGASNYSGTTTITRGTIKLGVNDALPIGTTLTHSSTGGPFDLNGFNQTVLQIGGASQGVITNTSATTSTLTITTTGTVTASSQVLRGNLNITKLGTGNWLPNSDNDFTGLLTLSGGTNTFTRNGLLGAVGQATVLLNGTGAIALNATAFSAATVFQRDIRISGATTLIGTPGVKANTISGLISGTSTDPLRYGGPTQGALVLAGANTYSGITEIRNTSTMLIAANDNAFGNSPSISTKDTSTFGTVAFQRTLSGQNVYVGGTTAINIITATSGNGLGHIHNLSGDNSFGGPIVISVSPIFSAEAGSSLLLKGVVSESGTRAITKNHAGTVALSGANTYTGATNVNNGILRLDFDQAGAPTDNIINNIGNSSSLVLAGGTLNIKGRNGATANSQQFNGLTVNAGASSFMVNQNSNSAGVNVALGTITRTAIGGTIDFVLPTTGVISTAAFDADGILGGYATVGGSDWATASSGNVAALTAYNNDIWGGTTNTNVTISSAPGSDVATNSLRFNTAATTTVTLAGTNNVVTSGGILVTSNVGNNLLEITGGTLRGLFSKDLIVIQNNTANTLQISSEIADNAIATGLTKSGHGTLNLASVNIYTGATTVTGGVLRLILPGALPGGIDATGGTSNLTFKGGVLGLNTDFNRGLGTGVDQVQFTGSGGFAAYGAPRNVNIGGAVTPSEISWGSAAFLSTGSALMLSADDATAMVDIKNPIATNVGAAPILREIRVANGGAAVDGRMSGVIRQDGGILKTGAGTLELAAANTYNGATQVDGGTLLLGVAGALDTDSGLFINNGSTARFNANTVSGGNFMTATSGLIEFADGVAAQTRGLTLGGGAAGTSSSVSTGTGVVTIAGDGVIYNGHYNNDNGGTISGNLTLGTVTKTFTINDSTAATSDLTVSAIIAGGAGATFVKAGAGTLNLTAVNTYAGATTVAAGRLLVSGSIAGNATVQNGATLGGIGTIGGTVTVNSGGTLAAGISPGTLDINNTLSLGAGSTLKLELGGTSPGDGPIFYDQVNMTNVVASVNLNSTATITLSVLSGFTPQPTDVFFVLTRADFGFFSTTFDSAPEGAIIDFGGGLSGQITYLANWAGAQATRACF